jgi:cellulose synthase/poly-beta-1,6-N-acetylglucosamine synthase-like glycosyltransferase
MQECGFIIANCPNAFVYTVAPETVRKLYRQRVRWISGFLKNSLDYKHLFFNKKYGDMGVFTLPLSLISIVAAIYFFILISYDLISFITRKIVQFSTVGLSFHMPHFDWFFLNTESLGILAFVVLCLTMYLILIGKKMAEGTMKPSYDLFVFVFLYGFITPFWLTKAVYNTITSRKAPWR